MKKNPEIQKLDGTFLSIHYYMNLILATKSITHELKGFKLGYDTFCQYSGTILSNKAFPTYYNSDEKTTNPLIALVS